jgi:hypothetical protein
MDTIKIAKEVLSNFEKQVKEYNLDTFDQTQILRTACSIIDEEGFAIRNRKFAKAMAELPKRGVG